MPDGQQAAGQQPIDREELLAEYRSLREEQLEKQKFIMQTIGVALVVGVTLLGLVVTNIEKLAPIDAARELPRLGTVLARVIFCHSPWFITVPAFLLIVRTRRSQYLIGTYIALYIESRATSLRWESRWAIYRKRPPSLYVEPLRPGLLSGITAVQILASIASVVYVRDVAADALLFALLIITIVLVNVGTIHYQVNALHHAQSREEIERQWKQAEGEQGWK